ncbi:hypothetical protein D5I55_08015 [Chakrabartia godavariana]|nr:hypothetical protein D5I55_08015 [Chakrabartia godavariana]
MAQSGDYFLSQAQTCAEAARTAPLPQLRDKYLRAQIAWEALADKEIRIRDARERRIAERAEADGVVA